MSVGLPHAYFTNEENKVYKVESESLVEGNTLKVFIPQKLGGKNVKGTATYEMELNKTMEIQKINLVAIRVEDSISNRVLIYQRYQPSKRIIEKPTSDVTM